MTGHRVNERTDNSRLLFRLIIPRVPYPNVFSHIAMPPLGALYVASAIERDGRWDVEVIDELNWRTGVKKHDLAVDPVADHRSLQSRREAQGIGFYGGLTSTVPRLFELAAFYRSCGVPTVAGGAHVDALPDEALSKQVDIVVHGEGEESIIEILEAWSGLRSLDDIRGISFRTADGTTQKNESRKPICDLDRLPTPNFKLLRELKRPLTIAPFERTRGCNFNCEFCIVNDRFGPSRSASPERVASEIGQRIDEGFRYFFCVDDNFTQGREDTIKLLGLIREMKKRKRVRPDITVQVRSSVGRDEELMTAMRAAGVRMLAIGLESPIREELKGMDKHQTPEQIEKDVRNIRRRGFMIHGMFIFGYPLEDSDSMNMLTLKERADRYISFIRRTAIDTIQVLKPVPIPGSRLAKRLADQGRIFPLNLVGWDKYDGNFLTFLPDLGISASELQQQGNRIMRRFYSPFSFLKFPVLVFTTPVDILSIGFGKAAKFAHDPAGCAQAALKYHVERASAFKTGFLEAGREIRRRWRTASFRTLGSAVVTSAYRAGRHKQFIEKLKEFSSSLNPGEKCTVRVKRTSD